nr:SCO2322 family protein [Kribbella sandramycini]
MFSVLAGLVLVGAGATQAQAEDGYRFWGYYQWSGGQWAFAQKGADVVVPADGSVEGWRYAVGGAKPRVPRAAGDFAKICADTPAESGKKRVAVVVDDGTAEDALTGEQPGPATGTCVVTDPAANGAKVLAAIAPTRIEKGLTCGIDGYPSKGCGDQVKNIKVPATDAPVELTIGAAVGSSAPSPSVPDDSDDSAVWPLAVGGAIIALLAVGGIALVRRRRTSE